MGHFDAFVYRILATFLKTTFFILSHLESVLKTSEIFGAFFGHLALASWLAVGDLLLFWGSLAKKVSGLFSWA